MSRKHKILLVEDEPILAFTEEVLLTDNGYEVTVVNTGEAAIKCIHENPSFSLVLMDIDLGPGIDGTEAAQKILENHEVPIVFYTSHAEKEIVNKVRKITRYGLVTKMSGPYVLLSSIEMALDLFTTKKELAENEERWNHALSETLQGVWDWDIKNNAVYYSPQWKTMLGFSQDEIDTNPSEWIKRIHPSDRKKVEEDIQECIQGDEQLFRSIYRIKNKDNSFIWVLSEGAITAIDDKKNPIRFLGTQRNITTDYLANEKYRKIAQHIPGVIYQFRMRKDGSSHFPFASQGIKDIYNVYPEDVIDDSSPIFSSLHPDEFDSILQSIYESRDQLTVWNMNYRVKQGHDYVWVQGEASPERLADGSTIWHGYIRNLSKTLNKYTELSRKNFNLFEHRLEDALEESRYLDLLKSYFDDAPIAVFFANEKMQYTYVNKATADLLGYSKEELESLSVKDISSDVSINENLFGEMKESKKLEGSAKLMKKDGTITETIFYAYEVIRNHYISFNISIDELSRNKRIIENQKAFFESVLDLIPINIYTIDSKGTITFVNKSIASVFEVPKEEIIGKTAYDFFPAEDAQKYLRDDQKVMKSKKLYKVVEKNVDPKTKKEHIVQTIKSPIIDINNKVTGLIGIYYDITEEYQQGKQKELVIEQKTTLLNEAHHRIKNNLSILFSLMNMQADMATNEDLKVELKSASSRILAIGNLYDKIYNKDKKEYTAVHDYLMDFQMQLVKHIVPSNIELEFEVDQVHILENRVVLLAIFLNELITNSIKYAFDGIKLAHIKVQVEQIDEHVEVTVTDNGVGFPNDVLEGKRKGFGLNMIKSLLKTINGKLVLDKRYPNRVKLICHKD